MAWLARIPERIGYSRDGRGWLLTRAVPLPETGEIPRHERFYYLELLRRAGLMERFPESTAIRLDGLEAARDAGMVHLRALDTAGPVIGISPGAAYGNAKRWLPERFAEAAASFRSMEPSFLVFGSEAERDLCDTVVRHLLAAGLPARNLAGRNHAARVHRPGRRLPPLSDQRFGRHACRFGAGCAHGGRVRRHRRHHHRPHRRAGPRGARTRRMQPVPAARMPHRPPLHDPRHGRARDRRGARSLEGIRCLMDTRTKILSLEAARDLRVPGLVMVTGYFDLPCAAHVCELEGIRQRTGAAALLAVVLPWDAAFLSQRARAEMAAALRVIDYVVAIENDDLAALAGALGPADVVRLEAAHAGRNRDLIEHVHRRHSA